MMMPKSAEPIGMPAAITEPKATSSTMMATSRPIASLPSTSSTWRTIARDSSAWRPASRAISMAPRAPLRPASAARRVDAVADRRVGDASVGADDSAGAGSNGSVTASTWGPAANSASVAAIVARAAGSVMSPSGSANTTWPLDATLGRGSARRAGRWPCWASVPGMVQSSLVSPPTEALSPRTAIAMTSQAPIIRHGCCAAACPSDTGPSTW